MLCRVSPTRSEGSAPSSRLVLSLPRLLPPDAVVVDALERHLLAVAVEIIVHGGAARPHGIVVDHDEAAGRQFRVERVERIHGRIIEIAVEPDDGKTLCREPRPRLAEPALD